MLTHQNARKNSKRLTFVRAYRANNLLVKRLSMKLYMKNTTYISLTRQGDRWI